MPHIPLAPAGCLRALKPPLLLKHPHLPATRREPWGMSSVTMAHYLL